METVINYDWLMECANNPVMVEGYQENRPFPHAVIDGVLKTMPAANAANSFPKRDDLIWYKYDNQFEKKLAFNDLSKMPEIHRQILLECNQLPFLQFLEKLTGIENLIPDPEFLGGGLHQILPGGKLDVHADFNYHKKTGLDRRLNVLIYLNMGWREEYGGHLELWDVDMKRAEVKIPPAFNRMVVFSTTDFANHGHPEILKCPENMSRKSMALYYYSNGRPESEKTKPHSTVYKRRPEDALDEETERLRQVRAHARLRDMTTRTD